MQATYIAHGPPGCHGHRGLLRIPAPGFEQRHQKHTRTRVCEPKIWAYRPIAFVDDAEWRHIYAHMRRSKHDCLAHLGSNIALASPLTAHKPNKSTVLGRETHRREQNPWRAFIGRSGTDFCVIWSGHPAVCQAATEATVTSAE